MSDQGLVGGAQARIVRLFLSGFEAMSWYVHYRLWLLSKQSRHLSKPKTKEIVIVSDFETLFYIQDSDAPGPLKIWSRKEQVTKLPMIEDCA